MSVEHIINLGEFYSIYGVVTLIIVLMLLWYFVKTNIFYNNYDELDNMSDEELDGLEGLDNPDGDADGLFDELEFSGEITRSSPLRLSDKKPYHVQYGTYGDVPVVLFGDDDLLYSREWGMDNAIYVPNTRRMVKNNIIPREQMFW
jgi:hypothetical protein